MLTRGELAAVFREKFPDYFHEITDGPDMLTIHIRGEAVLEVLRMLKNEPRFAYNFLVDVTAVDHLEMGGHARFCVVYHLLNQHEQRRIRVRAWVHEERPELPSVESLWRTADWQEREVYDLFGLRFTGHPDLRRILNPDYFEYHPLRKDYPYQGRGERDNFKVVKRSVGSKWPEQRDFE